MFSEMMGKCDVSKKFINALIDQPVLGSIFIVDAAILSLHKPPFLFSAVMIGGLIGMSMYFGQKLALFQCSQCDSTEQTQSEQTEQKD
jgi:hypothetical protein